MILDAITTSPLNVFFTIVIGIGLAYLYCRKPSSSSSSSTSSRSSTSRLSPHSAASRSTIGIGGRIVDEELQRTIAQIERQERDMIRQEQDAAYQQSLKTDREKQLKKEEESKKKEAEEKAEEERVAMRKQLHDNLIKLRGQISDKLPPEPSTKSEQTEDIVKLVFKLPDGTRVKRNFLKGDKVKYLYWYVFSLSKSPLQFKMTTNFPKRDLPGRPPIPEDFNENSFIVKITDEPNCEQTLEEASLVEDQIIFVYDLEA